MKKLWPSIVKINRRNNQFIVQIGDSVPPVCHREHLHSIRIQGVISSNGGKCPPIYIKEREKMNTEVYITHLKKQMVPWHQKTFPDRNYMFQQDGAPSHGARKTQQFLKDNI